MNKPEHSRLGASGAERWMNCPGSVDLLNALQLPPSDDPTYRKEGTAMHHFAQVCLEEKIDAWEIEGREHDGVVVDAPMALHIQEYLDYCTPLMAQAEDCKIEYRISAPVHPDFYGTADFVGEMSDRLVVVDLKGGKGIVVEPEENPQLKYYAFGVIYNLECNRGGCYPGDWPVDLVIVQPRAWHGDGPIRSWRTTVDEIKTWTHDTLVPAMVRAELDNDLDAGDWCRFCPAKLVCPLLTSLFGAAARANPADVVNLDPVSLGRSAQYIPAVDFYKKALQDEIMRRSMSGVQVPGTKVVLKKANRVWHEGAADLAKEKFGPAAFTEPEIKGPAAIEKLGPLGTSFVRQYAYTPHTGYTIALESDKRPAIKIEKASEAFASVEKMLAASLEQA